MSQPNIFIARLAQQLEVGGTETEIFLDRLTTLTNEPITASDFTLFGRGILTVNPDGDGRRSYPEYVSFTGIDQTNLSLTGAIRGLSSKSNLVVEENKRYHPAGTRVAITFGTHDISDVIAYVDNEIAALTLGSNQVVTGTAGETLVAGEVVYLKDDGKWWKARADQQATVYGVQLGVAQGAGTADAAITNGVLRVGTEANQSGLTAGDTLYISNTPGAISSTPGTIKRAIGVARSSSSFYFDQNYQQVFINESEKSVTPADDAGKVVQLESDGKISPAFIRPSKRTVYDYTGATQTWTKPDNLQFILVQMWGAGGSGQLNTGTTSTGGGGGGGYVEFYIAAADLPATVDITVGQGGAARTGSSAYGITGGSTIFGSIKTVTGGVGGNNVSSNNGGGFGGGTTASPPASSIWGGGGGGFTTVMPGGIAAYGGGGGGGTDNTGAVGGGGVSINGGNGGGAANAASAGDGQVPGGGGGACRNGSTTFSSGAGGHGRVIVTEYY